MSFDPVELTKLLRLGEQPDDLLNQYADGELGVLNTAVDEVGRRVVNNKAELEAKVNQALSCVRIGRNLHPIEKRLETAQAALKILRSGVNEKSAELLERKKYAQELIQQLLSLRVDAEHPSAWDREFPKVAGAILKGVQNGGQ